MPPDPRDWLPEGHLAWFVLESVERMDLAPFMPRIGWMGGVGRRFEPQMMVSLPLYACARGERSSRAIERSCVEDVAYRVIAAHQAPDHATIARFRVRHEQSLADLFTDVHSLCKEAGASPCGHAPVLVVPDRNLSMRWTYHSGKPCWRAGRLMRST
jgi:hypothetical protein